MNLPLPKGALPLSAIPYPIPTGEEHKTKNGLYDVQIFSFSTKEEFVGHEAAIYSSGPVGRDSFCMAPDEPEDFTVFALDEDGDYYAVEEGEAQKLAEAFLEKHSDFFSDGEIYYGPTR